MLLEPEISKLGFGGIGAGVRVKRAANQLPPATLGFLCQEVEDGDEWAQHVARVGDCRAPKAGERTPQELFERLVSGVRETALVLAKEDDVDGIAAGIGLFMTANWALVGSTRMVPSGNTMVGIIRLP